MPKTHVLLTPAESKRLIAKAVRQLPMVTQALEEGIVVIATGTTTTLVAEEFLGQQLQHHEYITGVVLPQNHPRDLPSDRHPDIVLRNGCQDPSLDRYSALEHMQPGDVFIKGANALNYDEQVAGILIGGHGNAGTIGQALGHIVGRRLHLIIPVGLEKCIVDDIYEVARMLNTPDEFTPDAPRMMAVHGHIITEIEAFALLTGANAYHMASGGVGGAEGAVWLVIEGSDEELRRVRTLIESVTGEPRFLEQP